MNELAAKRETGADKALICAERIKARGRGNYGSHRCTQHAVDGPYCRRHAEAYKRAMVKLAAYSARLERASSSKEHQ